MKKKKTPIDNHPPHNPPIVYNSEQWIVEKEERRRLASKMRKKMGKFEPIIETVSGELKKASDLNYEEQQMEIIRCASDPIYFIETYLTIFDQTKGELVNDKPVGEIVPFKLFPFQRDLINDFIHNRFVITNKYRQAGITTTTCAYIAWYMMFNENRSVALVANKLDTARDEIMHDVVTFIDNCPKWLKPKTGKAASKDEYKYKDTQKLKRYDNGSSIAAFSSTGLRGFSPTLLTWDEVAWTEKSDKFWTSAYPTLQTGGSAIMVSCVTKDSFVFTDKGIKTISDFLDESNMGGYFVDDYRVLGKDKLRRGNVVFNNGFVDTLKIKTRFSEIETSLNHKFWTYKNGEYKWVEAKDLTLDDYVSIQKGMNIWGNNDDCSDFKPTESVYIKNVFNPKKITPDIAYLLGLYISEGYAKNVYNKNKTNIRSGRFVLSCGDCLDGILKKHNLTYHKEDVHYVVSSKNLNEFLEYLGFDITKKAKEKIIPPRLLEMSKENVVAMVQGIMDGDGWAMYNEKNNNITIGIGLSSPELIKQLRVIFNNFGVLTRFRYSLTKPTKKVKVYSHNYSLVASGQNAEKYFEEIGFRFERKNKIIENYNKNIKNRNGRKDVIPNGCIILRELYQKVKRVGLFKELLKEDIDIKVYVAENRFKDKPIIKSKLLKFIDFVEKETGEKQNLDHIINENIVWVKVKEITKSQNYTYDFSLPSNPKEPNEFNHSIVYNQMVTHQTPNGLDETFFKVFDGAKKGDNEFKAVELWWFNDPRYNQGLEWVKNKGQENEIRMKDENWSEERRIKLYIEDKWEATSPWFEKEIRNANGDMRKIAQEIQCVFGEALVTIKNIETGLVETIRIDELYNRLNT